jgi:general secretion pathway protein A
MRPDDDRSRLLERMLSHFHASLSDHRPVVLLVDEAQSLSDEALEELRLLSNFDTSTDKLVQVVLVGHPDLRTRISQPNLAALRQRIVLAKQLRGLSLEDTGTYIRHRLTVAGADPKKMRPTFEPQAIGEIHSFSRGMPRLINVMCDNCLLMAFVSQTDRITGVMARRVMDDMIPVFDSPLATSAPNPIRKLTGSTLSLAGNF